MGKFRRQRADLAMKKTLLTSQSLDESLLQEAAAKAFVGSSPPLTGANAVPVTSTPNKSSGTPRVQARVEEDEVMSEETPPTGF